MIEIIDKGTRYGVVLFDVPPVPEALAGQAELRQMAGEAEDKAFLGWWVEACTKRGFKHGRWANAEEIVHARRLLTEFEPDALRRRATAFLTDEARDEWQGPQLLRMLWAMRRGRG